MYIKIMKPKGGFKLLECTDHIEVYPESKGTGEIIFYRKSTCESEPFKVEITGDVYIVNDDGKTVSFYKYNGGVQ